MKEQVNVSDYKPPIFLSKLDVETSPHLERAIVKLNNILESQSGTLISVIPAFHRIQKCFGPIEFIDKNKFFENTTFDLRSLVGIKNDLTNMVNNAIKALESVEMTLINTFIQDPNSPLSKAYSDLQDEIESAITRTVWRSWTPNETNSLPEMIDSLLKLTMGNLRFARLALLRNSSINHPMTDDPQKEEGQLYKDWSLIKTRAGQKGYAPAAEESVILRETKREFFQIAKGSALELWLNGVKINDLAEQNGWTNNQAKTVIIDMLREACEKGKELYGWTNTDMAIVLSLGQMPNSERIRESWVLSDNEMWDLFNNLNLPRLMGLIEQMEPLEKRVILHRLTYIGDSKQSYIEWAKTEGISQRLYLNALKRAFAFILQNIDRAQPAKTTIRQIIDSSANLKIIRNKQNRRVTQETSNVLKIANFLKKTDYPEGMLTAVERNIIEYIRKSQSDSDLIPTQGEIAVALELPLSQITQALKNLSEFDLSKPQYATQKYRIERGSVWHNIIQWKRDHVKEDDRLTLLFLNPFQKDLFNLITTLKDGFYMSAEEIRNRIGKKYKKYKNGKNLDLFHKMKSIYARLTKLDFNIRVLRAKLDSPEIDNWPPKQKLVALELKRIIEAKESLGHGIKREIARKLNVSTTIIDLVIKKLLS